MSSTDKQGDVATKRAEENVLDKEKGQGDIKSDTSPHKRAASEINSADDDVKLKMLKTDHKDEKENGESEKCEDDGEDGDEDDDEVVPEGEDYDDEGDEDGAEDEGDDDDDEDA